MRDVHEIIADLGAAKDAYLAIANTAAAPELRPAIEEVKALQAELAAAISSGAQPCPSCGGDPHGMVQAHPRGRGGAFFEVGCPNCSYFRHTDGTVRDHGAQGGMPRHAVESWNAGPNFWKAAAAGRFTQAEVAELPPLVRR